MSIDLVSEILRLKKEKDYVILCHNYSSPTLYPIADYFGDSLGLSKLAAKTSASRIMFIGVTFMAETALILSPEIMVQQASFNPTCPMAAQLKQTKIKEFKEEYPEAAVVTYVNTRADSKALSDVCVTSANADLIVRQLDEQQILFGPDANLAAYVQKKVPEKEIIPMPGPQGGCYVHKQFKMAHLDQVKAKFPEAISMMHPEASPELQNASDYVLSTGGMERLPTEVDGQDFIVGTEIGMVDRLAHLFPDKNFHPLFTGGICYQQKKNTLYSLYESMAFDRNIVRLSPEILTKARAPIERMLKLS
jgi:quinolinate synthase